MNGATIRHAAALTLATIAGCAPPPAPPAAAPVEARKADDAGRRAAFDEADKVFRRGYIEAAKTRWRAMTDYPSAVARVALLENRPEAVLALPVGDDLLLLRPQALAATQLGDVEMAERLLPRLNAAGDAAPWLSSWLAMARMARARRLLRVTADVPAAATFDLGHDIPVIAVRIGDRTERFLLDTSTDAMVIDTGAAERLGVRRPAASAIEAHSSVGTISLSLALLGRLEVLGLAVEDVPVTLSALGPDLIELGVAGILSAQQLFRRDVVTLDYAAKRVERSRRSRAEGWPLAFLAGKAISVEGRLEGAGEGLFQINTASASPAISPTYLKVGLANHAPWHVGQPQERVASGVGGNRRAMFWPVEGCRFCGLREGSCLDLPEIVAWDGLVASTQGLTGIEHAGVLGGAAFQGRVVEIDYPALRLRIRPGG